MKYRIEKYTIQKMMDRLIGKESEDYHLNIPSYQRDSVWNDSDVSDLLISLKEGYPIGAITTKKLGHDDKKDEIVLMDGLQRHTSLRKIMLKPFNYISAELIEMEFAKEGKVFSGNDKVNFANSLKDLMNDESFSGTIVEDDLEEITNGLDSKNDAIRIIKNIKLWIEDDMLRIKIPHIEITESKEGEEERIFTLINKKGRKLTTFESNSAAWSEFLIEVEKTNPIIDSFHTKRTSSYYNIMGIEKKSNSSLNEYDNLNILPSNFMLAVFIDAINDFPNFKQLFITSEDKIIENSIEPMINIIKYSIENIEEGDLSLNMKDFGCVIKKYVNCEADIIKIRNRIYNSFEELEKTCRILRVIKSNKKGKYQLKISSWLFAVLIIHILIKNEGDTLDNLKQWIIYELLMQDNYSSSTKKYAEKVIKNKWYFDNVKKIVDDESVIKFEDWLMNKLNNEEFKKDEESNYTKFAQTILGLIQSEYISATEDSLDIDHLIPKSTMQKLDGVNLHSLFNLSLLNSKDNRENKKAFLESDTLQKYDFIYRNAEFEGNDKIDYFENFEIVRKKSYIFELDENGKTLKTEKGNGIKKKEDLLNEPIFTFLRLRKKYIIKELEKFILN